MRSKTTLLQFKALSKQQYNKAGEKMQNLGFQDACVALANGRDQRGHVRECSLPLQVTMYSPRTTSQLRKLAGAP